MALPDPRHYPDLNIFLRELKAFYQDLTERPNFPATVNINAAVRALPPFACITLRQTNLAKGAICSELQATQAHFGSGNWYQFFKDASREFNG